jgi:phosphoribosyl 1,2-cyclic phosphodiesterase
MRVRFLGVRGSVPYATASSIGHGCNTPCIEVFDEATGRIIILDAGSGIVGAGDSAAGDPAEIPILLTHYHWDHVQGLPFFPPLYRHGGDLTVWAPALGRTFADLETMFEAPFFPVPYDRLPSRPAIRMLAAGETTVNGFDIGVQPLNHPGGAFAYRVRGASGSLVYATDHEFGVPRIDDALRALGADATAVILDAHFTPDELPDHKGWGHGDWSQCAQFAAACGAAHLWLFHHKPGRTDEALKEIEAEARLLFEATDAASEGDTFVV